jgi:hypothetical protein
MRPLTSPPLSLPGSPADIARADIVLEGVEHGGASFEARIFLNNPRADETTPTTAEAGYAGSIHVYGFGAPAEAGGAAGSASRARPAPADVAAPALPGRRAPTRRSIIATEAVRRAAGAGRTATVTVVPIVFALGGAHSLDQALSIDRMSITWNSH